jgi:hypothetical protein
MDKTYRITLWSGGKPVMVHYVKETPRMADGVCALRTDDGDVIRMLGTVSIEEGVFEERRIGGPLRTG